MTVKLPELPYSYDALAPYISAKTLEFHHDKHHATYVANTNKLIAGTPLESAPLEDIIAAAVTDPAKKGLFNNAAQVWNHTFYWNSLKANGGGKPVGKLAAAIDAAFGSFEAFTADFAAKGVGQFGSGWVWLVEGKDGKLQIVATGNADTPLAHGLKPLLTADVWEHAYYLDYQNRRPDYLKTFLENLANWDFASANFEK